MILFRANVSGQILMSTGKFSLPINGFKKVCNIHLIAELVITIDVKSENCIQHYIRGLKFILLRTNIMK